MRSSPQAIHIIFRLESRGLLTRFLCRVVSAKRIQLPIRPDDVRATAINTVFVPGPGVHEGLDEKAEGVRFVQLEFLQQLAERFGFAAAFHQVFEAVADFVAEEALHFPEVDEVAHRARGAADFEQVADGRAIRVAAGERGEILAAQLAFTLLDGIEDDVGSVEGAS